MQKKKQIKKKKNEKKIKLVKWTILCLLTIGAIVFILLSDLFNIKEISVLDNSKVPKEEIISISGVKIGENMFKFLGIQAEEQVKQNPYIEEAIIHRKLNGTIEIKVKERVATYMLDLDGKYAYINNQGYILEINEEKLELPIIKGYITEDVQPGGRLELTDLKKLDTVIQIMKATENKELTSKITNFDITESTDFLITMESENKLIHFGDASNINEKFLRLVAVLKDTVGQKGEIFVENIDRVYFREEVKQ